MRLVCSCLIAALASGIVPLAIQDPGPPASPPASTQSLVDQFLENSDTPLVRYRAVRRLEAAARGGKMTASLTAVTSFDPELGFRYEVREETGSGVIRSRVLRAALEAERKAKAGNEAARGALTTANYRFEEGAVGAEDLVRIDITPRRKDTMLIDGSILLTRQGADLVRVEGLLVKRPSFWTRRVEVVRRYARIAGVRVPISMDSTADVLIAGRSTFSMTYAYEAINGESVEASEPAAFRR
jgi:hypothetical protein